LSSELGRRAAFRGGRRSAPLPRQTLVVPPAEDSKRDTVGRLIRVDLSRSTNASSDCPRI
jgi:hypothetical protein